MIDQHKFVEDFHKLAQQTISTHIYSRWLKNIELRAISLPTQEKRAVIQILIEDSHAQEILQSRYLHKLTEVFLEILNGYQIELQFNPVQGSLGLDFAITHRHPKSEQEQDRLFFTDQYSFENFVLGSSNQFAFAAAKAISEDPGKCFNPLFIFGASGLGKTHLIRAIGHSVLKKPAPLRVKYVTCENFINDFTYFLKSQQAELFRKKYRDNIDVLLMDDIQFLSNKDAIQEEFFYTFNALFEQTKQIVITSDKVPKNLTGLESRIRTRCEWGLVADIQPPDFDTRVEILTEKMKKLNFSLDKDVIHFLASHFTNNIREIEGILHKLQASQVFSSGELNNLKLDNVKKILKPFLEGEKVTIQAEQILKAVAQEFGCRVLELKSSIKARDITLPRHISMYLIRKYTEKSYPEIGTVIGGKDHATVMHGIRKIGKLLYEDPDVRHHIEKIEEKLKSLDS